jgi:outer membrane protein
MAGLGLLLGLVSWASASRADELSFARALRLARDHAAEMRVARARVANGEAQVSLARAPYIPSLVATGSGTLSGSQSVIPGIPSGVSTSVVYSDTFLGSGALRWTVYDFGRTGNNVTSAEATLAAVSAGALDTEATLIDTVADAYLSVVYGERIRDIDRSILDQRERLLSVVKGLVKQAISPAVEELRAQARIEAARRDLEQAEGDLGESRTVLYALLGLDPRSSASLVAPKLPAARVDAQAASKEAEQHRPSVVSARAAAEASEAEVDSTRSRYLPSLGLTGDASYGYQKLDVGGGWLPSRSAAGALVLTVPIYDPSTGAQLDVAKAQAAEAEATYELQKRDARTDAARTVVRLGATERVLEYARKAAESSSAVLAVIRARYVQGLSSILDLIEAESADSDARLTTARAEQARDAATVHLLVATGKADRLWEGR